MEAMISAIQIMFFFIASMVCIKGFIFFYYKDLIVKSVGAYAILLSAVTMILLWNPILRGLLYG